MCGLAAQSAVSVESATNEFGARPRPSRPVQDEDSNKNEQNDDDSRQRDNFNLSPGMDAAVMHMEQGTLQVDDMKWGLITKSGTSTKPLYQDSKDVMKMCFERLCYNARSDTLYSKPTFSKLAVEHKTCVVALDGYFEWKSELSKGKKQPYFVYRKPGDPSSSSSDTTRPPLWMAGLWTRVTTGITDKPTLESFTILTTEACDQISWLHHRMPMCIWDKDLALRWLKHPSEAVMKEMDVAACRNATKGFAWHKVTPEMTSLKFRSANAIQEFKDPTQSVKAFFAVKKEDGSPAKVVDTPSTTPITSTTTKRAPTTMTSSSSLSYATLPKKSKTFSGGTPKKTPTKTAKVSSHKSPQKSITSFFTSKASK